MSTVFAASRRFLLAVAFLPSSSYSASGSEGCLPRDPLFDWQEDSALHLLQRDSSRSLESRRSTPAFTVDLVLAAPAFVVDLDLPPRDRFRDFIRWRARTWPPDSPSFPVAPDGSRYDPVQAWIDAAMPKEEQAEWLELLKSSIGTEYLEELLGAQEELDLAKKAYGTTDLPYASTVDEFLLDSILFELAYPKGGCSGILTALPNGTVIHGRNHDYNVGDFPGNNNNITQQVTFMRGGVPLFTSRVLSLPFAVGTAMRFGGWSIEQNEHTGLDRHLNLANAKAGGKFSEWEFRRLMETVPDFETAMSRLRETKFIAPQYIISAGAGPDEGAVLTVHRAAPEDSWAEAGYPSPMVIERRLAPASGTWYLAQTNDNAWAAPYDERRVYEQQRLEALGRGNVTAEKLMQLLRTPPARENNTLYSWVMVPATNFTNLIVSKHVSDVIY